MFLVNLISVFLIALGLSIDSFTASIACGTVTGNKKAVVIFGIPLSFAFFQGLAPLLGWQIGAALFLHIKSVDHWLAFVLLVFLGVKMIIKTQKDSKKNRRCLLSFPDILIMSVATSVDAFIVGLGLAFAGVNIFYSILVIAAVTFFISFLGIIVGEKIKNGFLHKAGILGGLVLILIGLKIFFEHTL